MQGESSREQQPTAEAVLGSVPFTCGSGGYMGFLLSGVQQTKGLGYKQVWWQRGGWAKHRM